jgi:predicted ATPase
MSRTIIAVTGGSCSGKTTLAESAAAHFPDTFWVAAEAARILIEQARVDQTLLTADGRRQLQLDIYALQRRIEDSAPASRIVLADRGSIDSASYWPEGPAHFWQTVGSTYERELARYHAAIWLESAAAVGAYASSATRPESGGESLSQGDRIRSLWADHPNLHIVPAAARFEDKAADFLSVLSAVAAPCIGRRAGARFRAMLNSGRSSE